MTYFVTSTLGIEDIVADEVRELGASNVSVDVGKVFFKAPYEFMYKGNFLFKTVNRLFILLMRERFKDLKDIERLASGIDYTDIIDHRRTFAVRAERIGVHNFTSIDVGRVVGSGIIKSYMKSKGVRLKVNLDEPDIEIYALVRDDELIIGVNTSGDSLHRRRYRIYNHPAALKTTLASVLVRLVGYDGRRDFLDPMCGGGTIVIEALHRVRHYPNILFRYDYGYRKLRLYDKYVEDYVAEELMHSIRVGNERAFCIDISPKHIEGAKLNALSGRVLDAVNFIIGDSTRSETFKETSHNVSYIALNPPYGMRFHNPKKIPQFYETFVKTIKEQFSGAYMALITGSPNAMEQALSKYDVKIARSFWVMHGGIRAKIYLVKL